MSLVVKNILRFATGSTLGGVFNFLTTFLVAKLVGPEMWGIWMIFNIILKFSPFTQLGVSESIQRNVPILIAENKLETVRINQNNAYGFSWLMGTVLLVAFMLLGPSLLGIDKTYCYLFA
ncbi:MAG: hypothetical protein RLP12_11030, partial [Ekhidna sp.]